MKPSRPCGSCGSTRFRVVEKVTMKLKTVLSRGDGGVEPELNLVVCLQCGATQCFMLPGPKHVASTCYGYDVDVAPQPDPTSPYR